MLGCILAGVYTKGALTQLISIGFKVLYLSYDSVIEAFAEVGVNAAFNESTPDVEFRKKMTQWSRVPKQKRVLVWNKLLELNRRSVQEFMSHLKRAVERQISAVRITPLHGSAHDCVSVADAISFVTTYDEAAATGPLVKYEIQIRYDNGDKVDGEFQDRATSIEFLEAYQSGNWTPAASMLKEDVE
jgi:hypothetical protein